MLKTELFTPISSNVSELFREIQRPILLNQFNAGNSQVLLMLTDNYLVLCENTYPQVPTHFCRLEFSVKSELLFQTIRDLRNQPQFDLMQPLGITFQRQQCSQKITFYSQIINILDMWISELEKRINQRNFHKLFKPKRKIGKGAFATVYLALRLRDKKMRAVKSFSKQKQYSSQKGRESLQNQINLMRSINHNNIMKLDAVYETQNSIYIILEYLEGVQLNDVLKSSKVLGDDQKCEIMNNLLKGLQYLSDHRIIHRDLKPENIMFRSQDSYDAVICDFGLATHADAEEYLFVRCGTPGFLSPQIINIRDVSKKSDPISDVFSAGLIFHYLLLGHSVFTGKKYNQVLSQNRACQFDFSQEKYQQISPLALNLMVRMLQIDPSKRILAKVALHHQYFSPISQKMDIQETEMRSPFQQLSQNSYMMSMKSGEILQTTTITNSSGPKINFPTNNRHQQNQGIY